MRALACGRPDSYPLRKAFPCTSNPTYHWRAARPNKPSVPRRMLHGFRRTLASAPPSPAQARLTCLFPRARPLISRAAAAMPPVATTAAPAAAPAAAAAAAAPASNVGTQLVGCKKFVRHNPRSDRFTMLKFHSVEFYTSEATMTAKRWAGPGRAGPGRTGLELAAPGRA